MARNIKYQFLNAINDNFKEGMDKHSMKADGKMNGTRIFSYSDRESIKNLAGNFSNWMKEHYSEIKYVKDIRTKHVQGFLNEKAQTCTKATMTTYASNFRKLENLVNATYGTQAVYRGFEIPATVENTKIRAQDMDKADIKKLKEAFEKSTSKAKIAIDLAEKLGLRVSEISKLQGRDIKIEEGKVHIHESKGRRSRDVPIRAEDRAFFADLKSRLGERQRVCEMQHESINKAIRRYMKEIGISEKYKGTSVHAIRKEYAQKEFDRYRAEGKSIKEALGEVSEQLGHSKNRTALMKEYVLNVK